MALTNCQECGKQISDQAVSCPIAAGVLPKKRSPEETL
jgi:hypothetical protein